MDKFFQTLENELKNSNLTKEQKTAIIKNACELYRQKIDKDYQKYVRNQRIGAALEIGSALIPASAGATISSKLVPKLVQKAIGRKFTNDITSGAINGAISSSIYGYGEGLAENKNPLINSVQKASEGSLIGGIAGGTISKISNNIRANDTLSTNALRPYWGIPYRSASGNPQKAIETLKENKNGFVPNAFQHEKLGNIDLVWGDKNSGLKHIIERRNTQGIDGLKFVDNIPNVIEKGNVYSKQGHLDRKYIGDGINEISIKNSYTLPNKNTIKRQWVPSAYKLYTKEKNSQAAPVVQTLGTITLTNRLPSSDLRINSIINDIFSKNNPPKWVNSQTLTLSQIINNNIQNNIPKYNTNTGITANSNNNSHKDKHNKIFTIEDIGNMTPKEFTKNEKIINKQIQEGLIAPTTKRESNYAGYLNPISNDNKIFSQEDIGNLTLDEFTEVEKEIWAQLNSIGIPTNSELETSDVIYIAPYTRSDGVQVRGHYRSK